MSPGLGPIQPEASQFAHQQSEQNVIVNPFEFDVASVPKELSTLQNHEDKDL